MLLCFTSTRRLIRLSNFLFINSRFKLPLYEQVRDASKGVRTLILFTYIFYLTYMIEFSRMYTDLKKRSIYDEYEGYQRQIIQLLMNVNLFHFICQLLFMFCFMIVFAFYVIFQMCGLCHEEGTYDDEDSPPAPENIFQQIDEKLDQLKYKYARLAKKFEKKHKQAPKMCIICFEDFQPQTDVIQLTCNAVHIYHKNCLVDWLQKNKTCPLCRKPISHSIPRRAKSQQTQVQAV